MLTARGADQAGGGEEVYRVGGLAFRGEVGQDLTDHAAELVAVPGEACGDGDLRVARGAAEITKCSSGVFVYMQVFA